MPARFFICFIFLFGSLFSVFGLDSLELKLVGVNRDTAKVRLYNDAARKLISGTSHDYDKSLGYAKRGLALAEQISFPKGEAELNRTIGTILFHQKEYDRAIEYYQKALDLCNRLNDDKGMARNYYNLGIVYREQSKPYYSLENLLKALSGWKQVGDTEEVLSVYKDIILLYQSIEEYKVATGYAEEALKTARETGNKSEEASLYDILARISIATGNIFEVADYYDQSLKLYEESGDQLQVARITQNMAANLYMNDPEKAMDLLRKSADIFEKITPENNTLYTIYNNIGNIYDAENQTDSAEYYKEKALKKAILSKNAFTVAGAYYSCGRFYLNNRQLGKAEKYFREARDLAASIGLASIQSNALSGLSSVNYQQGDYKAAIAYLQKYQSIKDSLAKEENKKNVLHLTMQYEFEKAEREKSEAVKMQLVQKEQAIHQQRIIVFVTSVALIFTVILLGLIFHSNRLNRQANEKLETQHEEILRINNELQESHNELYQYKDRLEEMVREQTAKLQQSEIQLRTLSDNLPGGCIYRKSVFPDMAEVVSYISNTAEEWLGLSADDIMSDINNLYRLIDPGDLEKKRLSERESIRTMSSYSCEYRLKKGDKEVWLLENTMPHPGKNQSIVWDGIIVDITDRKNFESELIKAKEQAEESDMLKSSFLANMSHEIRTPMNGIVGFLSFIEKGNLSTEKRQSYVRIIRSNVQQLLQLIEDIIDISKIDSHQLALHPAVFDLNTLMDELEIFFRDFILKKDKNLELVLDKSRFVSPGMIEADPVRVRQILSNLIGNAVKFTRKGYIRFGYRLTDNCSELYFFVEDTGIGVPLSKQKYIFERFRQAHDEQTQASYGGTGLGLAISKNLVEMMGGHIGVESQVDVGSTFYFTLPFSPIKTD